MHRIPPLPIAAMFLAGFVSLAFANRAWAVPCDGGVLDVKAGSTLDLGWTGLGHGEELPAGATLGFEILRRCSDDLSACGTNGDCANDDCVATCDCEGDTTCEIAGPAGPRKCLTTLDGCVTNADCPSLVPCATVAGPPMPISSGGAPICVVRTIDGPWTGSFEASTGDLSASLSMRWRVFLGITLDKPCPRCGAPADNPAIGDVFVCSGGPADGASCIVEGVTAEFGGTSSDCPPDVGANVSGSGLAVHFPEFTTGTATRTAQLPCSVRTGNPLVPGSDPKCTDSTGPGDPVCASNADCLRCTGDPSIACTVDADCTGNGNCAEAPEQPVTCGYWCHCGLCDGNPALPCFGDSECPLGQFCVVGPGTGTSANAPQREPNDCESDGFVCGGAASEQCETTTTGTCSGESFRACSNDADCQVFGAGTCDVAPRSCFGPTIARTGQPSAIGGHCRQDRASCTLDTDCTSPGDVCVADSSAADAVALLCSTGSSSSSVNATIGIAGPGALSATGLVQICRCDDVRPGCEDLCASIAPYCGDGSIDAGEECDGGACCAVDCTVAGAGTPCRAAVGDCDIEEVCDGISTACPADETVADDGPCDDDQFCTVGDACTAGVCTGAPRDCDDGNSCTQDTCDELAAACASEAAPVEEAACFVAPKASLQIVDSATPGKDKLSWKWSAGAAFDQTVLGDPLADTGYTLCLYDFAADVPSLEAALDIAPSGTLWIDKDPKGLLYKDKAGASDGVTKAQLKTGASGKTRVKVAAGGASLTLPAPAGSTFFEQAPAVVVQLVNGQGACWTSTFGVDDTRRNEADAFKAQVK